MSALERKWLAVSANNLLELAVSLEEYLCGEGARIASNSLPAVDVIEDLKLLVERACTGRSTDYRKGFP